jgi:hypothetical protein
VYQSAAGADLQLELVAAHSLAQSLELALPRFEHQRNA